MPINPPAEDVWRDFDDPLNPVAPHLPSKPAIRSWAAAIEQAIELLLVAGGLDPEAATSIANAVLVQLRGDVPASRNTLGKMSDALDTLASRVDFEEYDLVGALRQIVDGNGRLLAEFCEDGSLEATLGAMRLRGGGELNGAAATTEEDLFQLLTRADQILLRIGQDGRVAGRFETVDGVPYATAADIGDAGGLKTRFDRYHDAHGAPAGPIWGEWHLRETRQRLRSLALGGSPQMIVAMQGDSWSFAPGYYVGPLTRYLVDKFGDAGPGYTGFGASLASGAINGNARPDIVTVTRTEPGNWTSVYGTAPMPDHAMITSSTAGNKYTVSYAKPVAGPDLSLIRFFALRSSDGQARYRLNGGSWVGMNLAGSGFLAIDITPPTGNVTLEVEVVSGLNRWGGVDLRAATKGVRVHKLGSSGTRTDQWASVDAAAYEDAMQALAPNLITNLGGTNSIKAYSGSAERDYVETLVGRWRAALPLADIALMTPPDNTQAGNLFPMSGVRDAHRQVAHDFGCAHVDLQVAFGSFVDGVAEYDFGTARPWMVADHAHPSLGNVDGTVIGSNVGANVIVDQCIHLLKAF